MAARKKATKKKPKGRAQSPQRARPSRRTTIPKRSPPLTAKERAEIPEQRRLAREEITRLKVLAIRHKKPAKKKLTPLKVAIGMKVDNRSVKGSPTLARNRQVIMTHYHLAHHAGYAQVTAGLIADNIRKKTRFAPSQLIIRLRTEPSRAGALKKEALVEVLEFHKQALKQEGFGGRMRAIVNEDGSLDGELRVDTEGDFKQALLALGDIMSFPRGL